MTTMYDKALAIRDIIEGILKDMNLTECVAYYYRYTNYLSKDVCIRRCVRVKGLQKYSKETALELKERVLSQLCESVECRESKAIRFIDFMLE